MTKPSETLCRPVLFAETLLSLSCKHRNVSLYVGGHTSEN